MNIPPPTHKTMTISRVLDATLRRIADAESTDLIKLSPQQLIAQWAERYDREHAEEPIKAKKK